MNSRQTLRAAAEGNVVQLVRGPMVSDILGHPDERRAVASRFLRAAPALTARMLAPTLYVHNVASDTFHEVRASAMPVPPPWSMSAMAAIS